MSDAEQPGESTASSHDHDHGVEGPGYATPQAAIEQADPEETAYVMGLHVGQDVDAPDFLAVVDVNPDSETYSEIVDRVQMPNKGDELHHFGWNACS
ncbi:MAG: selenium-binding protein SBP56-related protein, partial [Salinirussus sp.]